MRAILFFLLVNGLSQIKWPVKGKEAISKFLGTGDQDDPSFRLRSFLEKFIRHFFSPLLNRKDVNGMAISATHLCS